MANLSKMITDRARSAGKVLAAAKTHRDKLVQQMDAQFGAGAAAAELLDKLTAKLEADEKAMEAADLALLDELSDDSEPRRERDRLSEELHDQLVRIRSFVAANFSPELAAELGFSGATPTNSQQVLRLAQAVDTRLAKIDLSQPVLPLVQATAADLQALIHDRAEALAAKIKKVADEDREAEQALLAKREAVDQYDRSFTLTANLLSTLLQTAGERELARRVRPSSRRRGQSVEVAGGSAEVELPQPITTEDPADS